MNSDGHWHRRRLLLALFAVQAILGLGLLEVYFVAHQLQDPECPGQTSGNPNSCFFCSHLSFVAAEAAPAVAPPVRPDAQVVLLAAADVHAASVDVLETPARSPPASL